MKASEWRIGNLVTLRAGKEIVKDSHVIVAGDFEHIEALCLVGFKPIPLTEEWLEKFGFKDVIGRHGYKIKTTNAKVIWNEVVLEFWNEWHFSGDEGIKMSIAIKYVHQLQNIYFALTGEELTVKP